MSSFLGMRRSLLVGGEHLAEAGEELFWSEHWVCRLQEGAEQVEDVFSDCSHFLELESWSNVRVLLDSRWNLFRVESVQSDQIAENVIYIGLSHENTKNIDVSASDGRA